MKLVSWAIQTNINHNKNQNKKMKTKDNRNIEQNTKKSVHRRL